MPTDGSTLYTLKITRVDDKVVHVDTDHPNCPEHGEVPVHTTKKVSCTNTMVTPRQMEPIYDIVKRLVDSE